MNPQQRIEVVDYDPGWPAAFEGLQTLFRQALGELALRIEHVGSTAVPGLAAKPIIDVDIVIAGRAALPAVIARLAERGYRHEGDLGITDREAFRPPPGMVRHHPYVCLEGSQPLRDHLVFRDYLRTHPLAAAAYARLKRDILARGILDADSYGRAKAEFIDGVMDPPSA